MDEKQDRQVNRQVNRQESQQERGSRTRIPVLGTGDSEVVPFRAFRGGWPVVRKIGGAIVELTGESVEGEPAVRVTVVEGGDKEQGMHGGGMRESAVNPPAAYSVGLERAAEICKGLLATAKRRKEKSAVNALSQAVNWIRDEAWVESRPGQSAHFPGLGASLRADRGEGSSPGAGSEGSGQGEALRGQNRQGPVREERYTWRQPGGRLWRIVETAGVLRLWSKKPGLDWREWLGPVAEALLEELLSARESEGRLAARLRIVESTPMGSWSGNPIWSGQPGDWSEAPDTPAQIADYLDWEALSLHGETLRVVHRLADSVRRGEWRREGGLK